MEEKKLGQMQTIDPRSKKSPKDDMYDPLKQKLFFKDAVEIFKDESAPEIRENPPKVTLQPKTAQAPASPPAP
jgi:hypothetical protein